MLSSRILIILTFFCEICVFPLCICTFIPMNIIYSMNIVYIYGFIPFWVFWFCLPLSAILWGSFVLLCIECTMCTAVYFCLKCICRNPLFYITYINGYLTCFLSGFVWHSAVIDIFAHVFWWMYMFTYFRKYLKGEIFQSCVVPKWSSSTYCIKIFKVVGIVGLL